MRARYWLVVLVLGFMVAFWQPQPVQAQGRAAAARMAAEWIIERFGRPAAREGVELLARRIEAAAVRYGEGAILAARRVGPQFFKVVEGAGVNAAKAVQIMAEHGEPGVAWILSRPKGMQLVLQHGEAAAAALVRHPGGIAEPVIEKFGGQAVKALQAVGPQGGRRLVMVLGEGELAQLGKTPELLGVVARYGDPAMDFIFKHRFLLAGGATLGVFLANPEPFLNGARDITQIAAENAIRPLAEVPGKVAQEAASRVSWNLVFLVCMLVAVAAVIALVAFLPWVKKLIALWVGGRGMWGSMLLRAWACKPLPPVASSPSSTEPRKLAPPVQGADAANERKASNVV